MAKRKNLNGIPGNLANSYLSTLSYFNGGYSSDWLYNIAIAHKIDVIKIDVINQIILPEVAMVPPLMSDLSKLHRILESEILENGYDLSFIKEAVLEFTFETNKSGHGWVICNPYIIDINEYISKPKYKIREQANRNEQFDYN